MALEYTVEKTVAVLSEKKSGWKKELNLVSWGDNAPKYDIREWSENHEKMGKGVTFTKEELKALRDILNEMEL